MVTALERFEATQKGQLTKLRNRIANGVCPWCQRSFANVARHVEHQHPDQVEKMREAVDA